MSFRLRVAAMLALFGLLTGLVLAGLLVKLRADSLAAGGAVLGAYAQLTEEQTTRTFQNIDQTLETVEDRLGDSATGDEMQAEMGALLASRPFLRSIWVLDSHGRVVHDSNQAAIGVDLSDRAYFHRHRDKPGPDFGFTEPLRSRGSAAAWMLPASRALRNDDRSFAGVVVAAVDPAFFGRVWTVEKSVSEQATSLWNAEGVLLMRSPFIESLMGSALLGPALLAELALGDTAGTFRAVSPIDNIERLIAYRRLATYPGLMLTVSQPVDRVLAGWRDILWLCIAGWVVAVGTLAGAAAWMVGMWRARRALQLRYRMLFNANPFPMVVVDRASSRFVDVNDAALQEYGYGRAEALKLGIDDIYSPGDLVRLRKLGLAATSGPSRAIGGFRHQRKDGTTFDVEMHARAIELDGRAVILTTAENVTRRNATEDQLRQAQKMEAVGQLTGGIAHDFNNILTVILANADCLQEEENIGPEISARLDQIAGAVQRAADLTHQLLAFSRKQPLQPQFTDINDLVTDTGKLLRRALGQRIEIDSVLADGLWTVDIDRGQLETALINLCINARDAMPDGGKLIIETRNVTLDGDKMLDPTIAAGDYVLLTVTDTGSGMSPETKAHVFEPFFTTKEVGKGSGLGLSMVYGFIKQSDGHIAIHSEKGSGTTFRLYLRRSHGELKAPAPAARQAVIGGSERLLVVEDDEQVRANVVQQLESLGYAITQAEDATVALVAFETASLPFDLLLTDIVMPGPLDGKGLADEVAKRWPATRVVFMSGFPDNAFALKEGVREKVRLLAKPFRRKDLAAILRAALDAAP